MYSWMYKYSTDKKVDIVVNMMIIQCNILYKKNRNMTSLILG